MRHVCGYYRWFCRYYNNLLRLLANRTGPAYRRGLQNGVQDGEAEAVKIIGKPRPDGAIQGVHRRSWPTGACASGDQYSPYLTRILLGVISTLSLMTKHSNG
jgi:hypothetical protein